MTVVVTKSDIIAAIAYCGIRQSPYHYPKNLSEALAVLSVSIDKAHIFDSDKKRGHYLKVEDFKWFYDVIKKLIFDTPEIAIWNVTQVEINEGITDPEDPRRKVKYGLVGRGIGIPEGRDFIDLDALARNVYNLIVTDNEVQSDKLSLS